MKIFRWDRWTDLKEDRINSIDISEFKTLLEQNCYTDKFLYKKIYDPDFEVGLYKKSKKITENYYKNKPEVTDKKSWNSFPLRENSLVCYNYEEQSEGKTFLVFPIKNSLFTISPLKESCYDLDINRYNKGYWSNDIKWLENLDKREIWTESDCLVIDKETYHSIFEKNTCSDTDYSLSDRNILATTMIGEAGGKDVEMRKVMNVINNRARNTTPSKIAIKAR